MFVRVHGVAIAGAPWARSFCAPLPMRLLLVLLFVFAPRASADPPFLFKLVPDGPPYPLLDLPLTSNSPPYPRSIDIHEIPTSETLRFNTGNLFVQILDNSSSWAPAHVELQIRVCLMLLPNASSLVQRHPSYSAPLFNLSLSQVDLAELSDDAAAAGSREMCLFEVSVTTFASDLKCFARPPLHLHHHSPACFLYMAPLRDFPFVFDPALNAGGALVAGELYSLSSHITLASVTFAGRPKLHLSQQLSSFSCESFVMFRRRVSFAYLVQAEADFDDSLLRGDDAVVLQLQWRRASSCRDSSCVFFPNSTVNEGRNHLLQQLTSRFPHLHPNFIIFMDEDARLHMRGDDTPSVSSSSYSAHREFERLLLQWQPAIGVPYHSWHSLQPGAAVQTVDHFDHIVVALHDEVVDFYLPTETRFDSICWWHGQAVYSIISSMLFPNNTLQFNTIVSVNTGGRALSLEGVDHASSKYKKRTDFYPALMWILSSAKSLALLANVDITIDAAHFTYGTLANKGNRFLAAPRPSAGYPAMTKHLPGLVDCCHPYWMQARIAPRCLLCVNPLAHISQHGLRTFFAGPQSLWNPDISANDWLMQASSLNCYEYSARNLECDRPYAPGGDESFRAQWLQYRQLKQIEDMDGRLRQLEKSRD